MARYVVGRVVGVAGVLFAVSLLVFLIMHAVPGGPFDAGLEQGLPVPQSVRQILLETYHLDQPLPIQYLSYVRSALSGDLGVSFRYGEPVTTFLRRNWPATLQLGGITFLISVAAGLALGMIAALHARTWIDHVASVFVVTGIVVPSFVAAVLLMIVFSVTLRWLPTGGWGTPQQMILPVITYALAPTATIARFTRSCVLDALQADHIRTAHAKGLPPRLVLVRHTLRNAQIPLITVLGPIFVQMIVGSFFVETIFRIPGIGSQLTTSIYNRDYPLIMGLTLLWSAVVSLVYLASDVLYALADPRIRLAGGRQ